MRSRLLALAGALALALGGLLVSGSPAAAASHCAGWSTHPDIYHDGGIHFLTGTRIHAGPYTDCGSRGLGYPSHGIDVHCAVLNTNDALWFYLLDRTTGVYGWSRLDALDVSGSLVIPDCYNGLAAHSVS